MPAVPETPQNYVAMVAWCVTNLALLDRANMSLSPVYTVQNNPLRRNAVIRSYLFICRLSNSTLSAAYHK